jgi:hypothetical protein
MPSYGRAGGSLGGDAAFAKNAATARTGRAGEVITSIALDKMARDLGFAVLHDLRIPGAQANIDHIVVSGDRVWIVDTKVWKPGFYFTLFGRTYRGRERVPHADKRGIPLAHTRIEAYLRENGHPARMQRPVMVVHPSKTGHKISLWAYRPASDPGARVRAVTVDLLGFPPRPADAGIVAALTRLLH